MKLQDFSQWVWLHWSTLVIGLILCTGLIGLVWYLFIKQWFYKRRHGLIQTVTWVLFSGAIIFLIWIVKQEYLRLVDLFLITMILFGIAIAITASHAYNHFPENMGDDFLYIQSDKTKSVWLHSYFSWETINAGMTIIPLYCTCAAIYISGSPSFNIEEGDQTRVLIYSILSLVTSLSIYVIRPGNRAAGYRRAYQLIDAALLKYKMDKNPSLLVDALIEGERFITEQGILDS